MKIVKKFQMKIVIFTPVKNRCMLHGRVFVYVPLCAVVSMSGLAFRWSQDRFMGRAHSIMRCQLLVKG